MKSKRQGNGKTISELKKKLKQEAKKPRMKNHFNKILVPVDGSKKATRALDKAIIIASQFGSSIVMINAIPIIPLGDSRLSIKLKADLQKQAQKTLGKGKKLCRKNRIKSYTKIIRGEPGTVIVRYSHSKKFDLIVMGSSGKGVAKEIFLGSVSNFVLHKSKIPILVVK